MLVSIDKRGSVSLPVSIRKGFNLHPGSFLDLTIQDGGCLLLSPVEVYPTVRLSDQGLEKLEQVRQSDVATLPDWLQQEIVDAATDTKQAVS